MTDTTVRPRRKQLNCTCRGYDPAEPCMHVDTSEGCPTPRSRRRARARLTFGLAFDDAKVIGRHGYGGVLCGPSTVELHPHRFAFMHGTDNGRSGRCFGKALAQVQQ